MEKGADGTFRGHGVIWWILVTMAGMAVCLVVASVATWMIRGLVCRKVYKNMEDKFVGRQSMMERTGYLRYVVIWVIWYMLSMVY